ncbi:MAG: uridine kinase [Saprospiraceae bacterium]|nr:uridine kinase [Saprospiraceae bacterium]
MKKPLIIGITGGSGSGKTTFIRELRSRFSKKAICVVSQDDYYRPKEEQMIDPKGIHNFDLPTSIDEDEFVNDLKKLMDGEPVCRQEYTFNNDMSQPRLLTFDPSPIILVEGIFVFHFLRVRQLLDLKIFLHAKENLKVIRRIKRDQVERNYPLDDVLYRYEHHVLPTFEKYIKPYMDEADLIINNNAQFDMGLEVLSGFVENFLATVHKQQAQKIQLPADMDEPSSASR